MWLGAALNITLVMGLVKIFPHPVITVIFIVTNRTALVI